MTRYASIPEWWRQPAGWPSGDHMPEAVARYSADIEHIRYLFDAPCSPERRRRVEIVLNDWETALAELPWDRLSPADRVDALLMGHHISRTRWETELEARRFGELVETRPWTREIVHLLDEHRLLKDVPPRAVADTLSVADEGVRSLISDCDRGSVAPHLKPRLTAFLKALKTALEGWQAFYVGYEPLMTWWLQEPCTALQHHIEEALTKLEPAEGDGPIVTGEPAGRESLEKQLSLEMIPYTPEELIGIGEREAEWCRAEMDRAATEMGCAGDWRMALEKVKEDHVPPGEQARFVRELAREAVTFLEERDLLTIPELARDGWHIEMMTPERQKVNPFFLGGDRIIVSYPTADMPHEAKLMSMRGNNRHFSRATVQHELIPGHFLQYFTQARNRPYRRLFHTPFWTEGWALYWEMRLWELGFPRTPQERMGMLFWRLHRAARVIFSLKFHLGLMTAAECVEMLVCDVGHERSTAEGEVRRSFGGDYPPLYQCAYLIGGLQMRALHRELVETGRMTERAFHDRVLAENGMPLAVLRAIFLGDALSRDWRAEWRFT